MNHCIPGDNLAELVLCDLHPSLAFVQEVSGVIAQELEERHVELEVTLILFVSGGGPEHVRAKAVEDAADGVRLTLSPTEIGFRDNILPKISTEYSDETEKL